MRSDFLGDCARFPGLPEAVNEGQFLVPRLTRDERRAAIRLSARAALEAEVGDSHPTGESSCLNPCQSNNATGPGSQGFAGDVFFYGVGPSYTVYRSDQVLIAPVIEIVGWRVLGGLETVCVASVQDCSDQDAVSADGTNIVNLKAGVRAMVGAHSSFYVGYGHQLTHDFWYKDIVRAEYRHSF